MGRHRSLDTEYAGGNYPRVSPVPAHSGDRLLSEPTAGIQFGRREPLFMPLNGPTGGSHRDLTESGKARIPGDAKVKACTLKVVTCGRTLSANLVGRE